MYYEEKRMIDGSLWFRTSPDGEWERKAMSQEIELPTDGIALIGEDGRRLTFRAITAYDAEIAIYDADQMRAMYAAGLAAGMEKAAKICDEETGQAFDLHEQGWSSCAATCAAAIRKGE